MCPHLGQILSVSWVDADHWDSALQCLVLDIAFFTPPASDLAKLKFDVRPLNGTEPAFDTYLILHALLKIYKCTNIVSPVKISAPLLVLILLIGVALSGVLAWQLTTPQGEEEGGPAGGENGGNQTYGASVIQLDSVECTDQHMSMEAFTITMPSDWIFDGGITWRAERPLLPASLDFSVTASDGSLSLECFPDEAYFWVEGEGLLIPYDYGPELRAIYSAEYQGYWQSQPMSAPDYITEVLLPRYRGDVTDLQVVEISPLGENDFLPQLENLLNQRPSGLLARSTDVDAAMAYVKYSENGRTFEEELMSTIIVDTFYTTPEIEQMFGVRMVSTFWFADGLWSLRAENLSPENAKLLMTALSSFRWNPSWLDNYSQLLADLWQQHLQGVMNRHGIVTQTQEEVTQMITTTFANQDATMEKISNEWSNVIRGVEVYDPDPGLAEFETVGEPSVELPNGYDYAWTNKLGDYILTDSASFNPNVDLETGYTWTQMAKVGI